MLIPPANAVRTFTQSRLFMLQRFSIFALLLCALALTSIRPAAAKDSAAQAADRRAIVAAYKEMDRLSLARDTDGVMAYIAPDYMGYTLSRGTANREQLYQLTWMVNHSDARLVSGATKVTKIQWRGPDAVVWVAAKSRATGPRGTIVASYTSRHYWGKPYKNWLLRQDVTLTRRAFQNGKLLEN